MNRKMLPVGTLLKQYFPDAFRAVAAVSWVGNQKHNPNLPLHWARGKSDDHLDCLIRHAMEKDVWDVVEVDGKMYSTLHSASAAWRALALCQLEAEREGRFLIVREVEK